MATTGGPHAPEDGWQTRWLLQAAALLLQSPVTVVIGFVAIFAAAILDRVLAGLFSGIWGYVVETSISSCLAALVPVAVCASLGVADGHGLAQRDDISKGMKTLAISVFLISSIVTSLAVILLLMQVSLGAQPKVPQRDVADAFLHGGVSAVAGGLFATLPVNALWVALASQMPMSLIQLQHSGFQMMRKSFSSWAAIIILTMVIAQSVLVLPALAGATALIFLSAWLYVAAREIFGGISSNRYSLEVKSSLMEA